MQVGALNNGKIYLLLQYPATFFALLNAQPVKSNVACSCLATLKVHTGINTSKKFVISN